MAAFEGRRHPHFLDIGYGPSVACTVGCTWLMYSLCMVHTWPMYDLYMAYIAIFLYMPSFLYLSWSLCGLYCRLYMAYVQLMYGPYMAMYDLYMALRSYIASSVYLLVHGF